MSRTPSVRTLAADEWRTYRDLRLRALADSPDAFETTLAQARTRPDAEWRGRVKAGAASSLDLPLIAEVEARPLGLAWGRRQPPELEAVHVYQMWVDPSARRLGAGRMLLDTIITWATAANARHVVLGVTLGDTPAARARLCSARPCSGSSAPRTNRSSRRGDPRCEWPTTGASLHSFSAPDAP
jgi:GNAT superfamily N-acetyltransferase